MSRIVESSSFDFSWSQIYTSLAWHLLNLCKSYHWKLNVCPDWDWRILAEESSWQTSEVGPSTQRGCTASDGLCIWAPNQPTPCENWHPGFLSSPLEGKTPLEVDPEDVTSLQAWLAKPVFGKILSWSNCTGNPLDETGASSTCTAQPCQVDTSLLPRRSHQDL